MDDRRAPRGPIPRGLRRLSETAVVDDHAAALGDTAQKRPGLLLGAIVESAACLVEHVTDEATAASHLDGRPALRASVAHLRAVLDQLDRATAYRPGDLPPVVIGPLDATPPFRGSHA